MSSRPIPTPFDAPLPGEAGVQPAQAQSQVATPFDAPLPGEVQPADKPVQKPKSYVNMLLGIDPTSPQSPINPMQPGEQWAIQNPGPALGAAGIGAVGAAGSTVPAAINAGARAALPAVVGLGKWASENPVKAFAAFEALKELIPGLKKATGVLKKAPVE